MSNQAPDNFTFLFTDVEGSTRLWERQPSAMTMAIARHDELLREMIERHGGSVFKTVGDAVCAVFADPMAGAAAAVAGQRALRAEAWGDIGTLRVRMALHTGAAEARDGDFFGSTLNRVARLLSTGHGDQILLSRAIRDLVGETLPVDLTLRDLGEYRLKDLPLPERIFQLIAPGLPTDFPAPRAPSTLLHNLPTHPTPLIGRAREVAQVRGHLLAPDRDGSRLLTVTGPGGTGKTRLAIHLASTLAPEFADGVYFVSLASITEPALVLPEIASALGVRDSGGEALQEQVKEELRGRHLLLVLDNFEQVTPAATIISDLIAGAPRLVILVTSRERLRLRGEQELPLPPLTLPYSRVPSIDSSRQRLTLDELLEFEAIRLFVERASVVKPEFSLTDENAAAVVEICQRLDGLPLAIELAAARIRMLPPKAILARFDRRLDLLAGGSRDVPDRQQTMRNAIAWSYALLDPAERTCFAHLAIFAGGCTLDAAEAIVGGDVALSAERDGDRALTRLDSAMTLDLITSLADKSLVRLEDDAEGEPRLVMLETIRDYGMEQLAASGEAAAISERHAAQFLSLAEEAETRLEGPEQSRWLDRLERDDANLRAALGWLREQGNASGAVRLGGALWRFWWLRGHFTEGRAQLEQLADLPATPEVAAARVKVLNGAGVLAESQGECERATALHEEGLALARELGDQTAIAWSLNNLGWVAFHQGEFARAQLLLEENLAIARRLGDQAGIATALQDLGTVAWHQADYAGAQSYYGASLGLYRAIRDDSQIARLLANLGAVLLEQEDLDGALPLLSESLALGRAVGDKQAIAQALNNLAEVARRRMDFEDAAALYEESRALVEEAGDKLNMAIAIENLADLANRTGDPVRAAGLYGEALPLYRVVSDWPGVLACFVGLAKVAVARGQAATAARLLGAAAALRDQHGLPDADPNSEEEVAHGARADLGAERFATTRAAGLALPFELAMTEALASTR